MGSNVIMLFAGAPSTRGVRLAAGSVSRLTLEDAKAVQTANPNVARIYPEAEGNVQVVYGNQNANTEMQGVTTSYEAIRRATPVYGRFFTETENASLARVVLLGPTVVKELFDMDDPVGKMVKINRIYFKVIGILPTKGTAEQDDMIVVPITTSMRRVLGVEYLHEMAVECATPDSIPDVIADIERLMRHRHGSACLQGR